MANIRKLSNGTFQAAVYIGRDINGKMIRKYITRDSRKECRDAARELEQKIADSDLSNIANMKMTVYMDKWLALHKINLSATTVKAYKIYIETHFKPYFGNMKVDEISEMHVKQYISDKIGDLSSCTVRKHFFTLSKMLYDALKNKSPCIDIKPPKNSTYKPHVPSTEEFEKIWHKFKEVGLEDEIIILLAGWCGLRRGEIFALKQDDIDKNEGTIRIDEAVALEEEGYEFEFKEPKSENGKRVLVIPDYLLHLIEQLLKSRNIISPLVTSYNPHTFTKKYGRIIKANDDPRKKDSYLPQVRFHDLRHYHATFLYENDIPDHYAADRLGHDIWVLKKIYQHLGLKKKIECDEKVRSIFKQV